MNFVEEAVVFPCGEDHLLGVVARPERPARLAVVVIVGGPQYRVGSHRQFVALARGLAAAGHAVMRFDVRGMGDSEGDARSFEGIGEDIGAAIDALLARVPEGTGVVLWGLCDGASAALLYLHDRSDSRVRGLCLLNPWVRSEAGQARTQVKHYYGNRLLQLGFWTKLVRGRISIKALGELGRSLWLSWRRGSARGGASSFQDRMGKAWQQFPGAVLLILSGNDYTAKEFIDLIGRDPALARAVRGPQVQRRDAAQADHTFSDPADARQVQEWTASWLAGLAVA